VGEGARKRLVAVIQYDFKRRGSVFRRKKTPEGQYQDSVGWAAGLNCEGA